MGIVIVVIAIVAAIAIPSLKKARITPESPRPEARSTKARAGRRPDGVGRLVEAYESATA